MQFSTNLNFITVNSKHHYATCFKIFVMHLPSNFIKMSWYYEGQDHTNLLQLDLVSFTKYNVRVASHSTTPT